MAFFGEEYAGEALKVLVNSENCGGFLIILPLYVTGIC
ncbi:hypothetical protein ANAPC5_00535 [Anaplasma phagocytophilum]|nr:hypothetical protein ANAPC3_00258 [Anaplasma phagocytophilum]SBO30802.1 hypothetical protein ANAPC2_00407 [Anaplasma phagocytophilum]SBO31670.1 hypothetical protein ANAPC4_00554 [Anaplasma phagocytophilum]SCV63322.1 hypothetical protein ANAPC5_00535 [Anaplasma phagocytophilum]